MVIGSKKKCSHLRQNSTNTERLTFAWKVFFPDFVTIVVRQTLVTKR